MAQGNYRIRVRRRRGVVEVVREVRLPSGSYVPKARVRYPDRDLQANPLTETELLAAGILLKEPSQIE